MPSSPTHHTAPRNPGTPASDVLRRERSVLACACACTVLVVGFVASINLAIPALAASSLQPSPAQLLWVVDAYVLLFACLVIPAGALGDRVGQRAVLTAGLGLFAVGAVISAVAGDVLVMIAGRVLTGVGAAAVLPNALAVLVQAVGPPRRPRAVALWAAMSGAGGVVGNVGGGAVLATGSWRALFAVVAPVAVCLLLWVQRSAPQGSRSSRRLGLPAAILLTTTVLALLVAIIEGPERGWASPLVLGAFAASAALLASWVVVELRSSEPLLDPRLFRTAELRSACLGMAVLFFGMFALFFVNASLLQYTRDFSVLETGIAIVPLTLPLILLARRVPGLVQRTGRTTVLSAAFITAVAGLLGLATTVDAPFWTYAIALVITGTGVALALPALTMSITSALPTHQAGIAGGLQATTRELGSALGVAVIGSLTASHFSGALGRLGLDPQGSFAESLARATVDRARLSDAFASSAAEGLVLAASVVLVVGIFVLADLSLSDRRTGASEG